MKKLNKKGFTLTEMIVVIAIIGILAAVLIPSVVIYVQRAQKSNDEQLAASMTDNRNNNDHFSKSKTLFI